jgi:hypothetical protein
VPDTYDSYEAEKKKTFAKYVNPGCSFVFEHYVRFLTCKLF